MRVIVASLRFAPGHIAHLRAYRELFSSIGCDVKLYLENGYNGFIEEDQNVVFYKSTDEILESKPDMVLSYNIANENIKVAKQCKRFRNYLKNSLDSGRFLAIIYTYFYILFNGSYAEDENVLKANTPEERQQAVTATIDLCIGKGCLVR